MPQVAAFAAAGVIKATIALGGSAALANGIIAASSLAVKAAATLALSAASSLLMAPKVDLAGSPTDWSSDPNAPVAALFGEMVGGGGIVSRKAYGDENMYQGVVGIVSCAGPIAGIDAVLIEKQVVAINPATQQAAAPYGDKFWFSYQLGNQPETGTLQAPAGLRGGVDYPGWTPAHKLSGKAGYMATFGHDSKQKIWKRGNLPEFGVRARGQLLYNPQLDSTFPGGEGAHRLGVAATWAYSANPVLSGLKWALGLWEGEAGQGAPGLGQIVLGMGLDTEEINLASFAECANLPDALGWTLTARPTSDDDKTEVLKAMLQAGGCAPIHVDGVLTCIPIAAAKSSVVTLERDDDIIGPIRFVRSPSRLDRKNAAFPRFRSPAHNYDLVTADIVERDIYLTEDGGRRRSEEVSFPYVPDVEQAASLAAYWIADGREGFIGGMQVKPHLRGVEPGRCFTMPTDPDLGELSGKKLYLVDRKFDSAAGILTWSFREETDSKHTWAGGLTGTVSPPITPPVPPGPPQPPGPTDWEVTPLPPSPGGGSRPVVQVQGVSASPTTDSVLFYAGPTSVGPWTLAKAVPVETLSTELAEGLSPGVAAYIAVANRSDIAGESDKTVLGPVTVPDLVADTVTPGSPVWVSIAALVTALSEATSDDLLQPSEKVALNPTLDGLIAVRGALAYQAFDLGVTTERTAHIVAMDALEAYLATLTTPVAWDDLGGETEVDGATLIALTATAMDAQVRLQAAISNATRQWPNVEGPGRPEDHATVGARAGVNLRRNNEIIVDDADFITTMGISAGFAGQNWGATASQLQAANSYVPTGTNGVVNSTFENFVGDAVVGWYGAGIHNVPGSPSLGFVRNAFGGAYGGQNRNSVCAYIVTASGFAAGAYFFGPAQRGFNGGLDDLRRFGLRVRPGDPVAARAGTAAHGGGGQRLRVRFFKGNGVTLAGEVDVPVVGIPVDARAGGRTGANGDPANYYDFVGVVTAPAEAAYAVLGAYVYLTAGAGDCYLFVIDPMLARLPVGTALNAAAAPAYSAGPSDHRATQGARAGTNLFRDDGSTVLTQAEVLTSSGIAAGLLGEGPLATSALTEPQVRGGYFGEYAGDAAATAAGLSEGHLFVDTNLPGLGLKARFGGVIKEINPNRLPEAEVVQVDVTSDAFVTVAAINLTGVTGKTFVEAAMALRLETSPDNTSSSSGTLAPAGDWRIQERAGAGSDAPGDKIIAAGAWSSIIVGGGNPVLTEIAVDGDSGVAAVSDFGRTYRVGGAGDRRWYLQMKKASAAAPNLLDATVTLMLRIERASAT